MSHIERTNLSLGIAAPHPPVHAHVDVTEPDGPMASREPEFPSCARWSTPSSSARCETLPLTVQERAVAELAAAGLTNKEIGKCLCLSARTVSGHLYRTFPKLGILRRSALRDALLALED